MTVFYRKLFAVSLKTEKVDLRSQWKAVGLLETLCDTREQSGETGCREVRITQGFEGLRKFCIIGQIRGDCGWWPRSLMLKTKRAFPAVLNNG